ncbi:hypothetical protein L5515_004985 [Caenorhabditis briggsae]|uniref:Uncharacterized protein n=1 Tax=Caenorhabditis briggsae TaxID=6238 RepID=A0AAE9EQF4_CAEBR|nr:hypothetical protein L5515_004985 [Caenorhabditis briggsae]
MMSVSKVFLYLSPTICTRFGECEHRCLLGKINVTEIEEEGVSTYEERQLIFIAGDIYAGVKDSSFPMMLAVSFGANIRSRRTMIVDGVTSWFTSWYFIAMASIVIVVLIIVGVIFVKFYFERKVVTTLLAIWQRSLTAVKGHECLLNKIWMKANHFEQKVSLLWWTNLQMTDTRT